MNLFAYGVRIATVAGALFLVMGMAHANCPLVAGYTGTETTPDSDFAIDVGDGMVRHLPTGLIWKRCAEGQVWSGGTCTGTAATYTWSEAFSRVHTVNSGVVIRGVQAFGHTDWRLPNVNELRSLAELACLNPSINLTQFPLAPAAYFWSSSPYASDLGYAWMVGFDYGFDSSASRDYGMSIRLVRGGAYYYDFDAALPGRPTLLRLIPGNHQMRVVFTVAAWPGGSAVIDYTATCTAGGNTFTNAGATSPIVVTGLTNGTSYSCTVHARNSNGVGPESSALAKVARRTANVVTTTVILGD